MMAARFTSREALIPMVGGPAGGAVARVSVDDELPAQHPAQLDRELSELLECGLYQAGQQAKAAVRLLRLPGRGLMGRPAAASRVVNPGEVVGLGTENSSSAELGLAIGLLLFQAQAAERVVLASGALDLGAAQAGVRVGPVHHLARKLRLVTGHFSQPGAARPPRWFFVPDKDPDGGEVAVRYAAAAEELRALGIELRCVGTVAEAAKLLGARRLALRESERRLRRWIGVTAAAAALAGAALLWLGSPLPLRFITGAAPDGRIVETPARVVRFGDGVEMRAPCAAPGLLPAYGIGDRVAIRVHAEAPAQSFVRLIGGHHHLAVAISPSGLPKVITPAPGAAGLDAEYLLTVIGPAEDTTLVLLARRGRAFDADGLRAELARLLMPLPRAQWDSAARAFLAEAAPGVLTYRFRSVAPESCP